MATAVKCIPFVVPPEALSRSQPKVRSRRKPAEVLAFPSVRQVTLEDLAEYKILSREAADVRDKLARKREEIATLLRAGAHVEKSDILTARLMTISQSGKAIERLEVR
jgi:hypothetical protein